MTHAPLLPILIPLLAAVLQLAANNLRVQRGIAAIAALSSLAAAVWLLVLADTGPALVYALGDWPAPFSIVLVPDRLAAIAVMLTALLAAACLLYAGAGFDQRGRHFHAIFQLQLVGINGAFLTGDLFNLFVFFEVLLLASYVLLAYGDRLARERTGQMARSRAGLSYVVLNLIGSAIFLVALGLIYGTLGTLNLADIAVQLQGIDPAQAALVRLAGALLITVFALKAALLPLSLWLAPVYSAAGAPVAALFVIMTKVGVYAMLRLQVIALAPAAATADLLAGWLLPAALVTLALSTLGVLAAARLQTLVAWLVLGSAATLLMAPALNDPPLTAAALYYLVQSTLMAAAFFLFTDMLASARAEASDQLIAGAPLDNAAMKIGFFVLAATAIGLPPFSGFLGKLMLLSAVRDAVAGGAIWLVILVCGFVVMAALARAGSRLFWEHQPGAAPIRANFSVPQSWALAGLVAATLAAMVFAQPLSAYAMRAAVQLHDPASYIDAVLGQHAQPIVRQLRP